VVRGPHPIRVRGELLLRLSEVILHDLRLRESDLSVRIGLLLVPGTPTSSLTALRLVRHLAGRVDTCAAIDLLSVLLIRG